jgi:phosphatidyl-myo-inositol dimannoside synthase
VRTLWLTNDFPPQAGGIQTFVENLARRVAPEGTLVLAPSQDGDAEFDADLPYTVERLDVGTILPTPGVLRHIRDAVGRHRPDVIVLGASWPLGELGPYLADDPGMPIVALTHGLEAGLSNVGAGYLVRRATRSLDAVTAISEFTREQLADHLADAEITLIPPGIDVDEFHPGRDGSRFRHLWGIPLDAPLVGCISRLVRRKGQDVLLEAWPEIRRRSPQAWLLLVGAGPLEARLRQDAAGLDGVVVAGEVDWHDLPDVYAALDVFAMPCRTRLLGADVEGLGIVYLEAQATGVPVVVGQSGGAPETVVDGETGLVVDGRQTDEVADAIVRLLNAPEERERLGDQARAWVAGTWSWDVIAERFRRVLEDVVAAPTPPAGR